MLKSCIKLRQDVESSEVEKAWKNLWKIETSWEKILQAQAAIWSLYHILTQDVKVSWVWLLQISKNKTKNIERELQKTWHCIVWLGPVTRYSSIFCKDICKQSNVYLLRKMMRKKLTKVICWCLIDQQWAGWSIMWRIGIFEAGLCNNTTTCYDDDDDDDDDDAENQILYQCAG